MNQSSIIQTNRPSIAMTVFISAMASAINMRLKSSAYRQLSLAAIGKRMKDEDQLWDQAAVSLSGSNGSFGLGLKVGGKATPPGRKGEFPHMMHVGNCLQNFNAVVN